MIHHNKPPQQRRLHIQRRLQLSDAQAPHHAQDGIPRDRGGGVKVPRYGTEARLVEVVWGDEEGEEGAQGVWEEAVGVGGGAESVDCWADGGAAEPRGELGGFGGQLGTRMGVRGVRVRTYRL